MKLSKTLKAFLEEARKTDSYWAEHAKLEFSTALNQRRRAAKITYADIAQKIGTSAAYITKVFRGDSNVTIETMVKLARATGGQLDIRIVDSEVAVNRWDFSKIQPKVKLVSSRPSNSFTQLSFQAANHDTYDWERIAA